ncbi:MAG: SLBB domain-containing protein, partial [Candidatus Zixiibacteriota bacterium]
MKKALFWIIILILVSVTWFRPLIAETLSSEQIEELKKNPELYHQFLQQKGRKAPNRYTTPDIFERGEGDTLGLDSLEMSVGLPATDRERNDGASAFNDGGSLRPFGLEMFERTGQLAAPIEIANSGNYLLGPGDNLLIYLWGKVEREFNLTIDRQGKLFVPPIGEVVAWGQSLDDFRDRLRDRFRSVYSDFRLNVTLGKIRSIRVYLIGEVKSPGAYTVSSLTTFFNALYQAGGPTERGSLRHIKLLRDGTLLRQIDLYDLLLRGDNSLDITLRSGDAVFVPVVKAQASVTGEVKRPAIYELLGDETVADLLELAGGKTAIGYLRQLSLERVADGNEPKLIDINLDPESSDSNRDFLVLGGDRMTVHSMYDVRRNYVAVGGMVKHPGRFEREDGLTLPGLIERAELRPEDVYQPRLNLFRTHPDNRHEVINVSLQDLLNNPEA